LNKVFTESSSSRVPVLSQLVSGNILAQPSVPLLVELLRTKLQASSFIFSSLWQHGREKIMYQQLQKFCRDNNCHKELFGKIWTKYPLHTQKITCCYTYDS